MQWGTPFWGVLLLPSGPLSTQSLRIPKLTRWHPAAAGAAPRDQASAGARGAIAQRGRMRRPQLHWSKVSSRPNANCCRVRYQARRETLQSRLVPSAPSCPPPLSSSIRALFKSTWPYLFSQTPKAISNSGLPRYAIDGPPLQPHLQSNILRISRPLSPLFLPGRTTMLRDRPSLETCSTVTHPSRAAIQHSTRGRQVFTLRNRALSPPVHRAPLGLVNKIKGHMGQHSTGFMALGRT